MHRYLTLLTLSGALCLPLTVGAQDRERDREHNQQNRRYEDKAHKDFHEWNDGENQYYRQYLLEHHKKTHDFEKANRREQNDYWNWRHRNHPDDRR